MKKVLALYYSQTGQLERIVRSTLSPFLERDDVEVHFQPIQPVKPYPFPWPVIRFFDQFPECVMLDPPEIELPGFDPSVKYDLVVFGYQTWYLSPSSPATGFLKSGYASVLRDTPVVTVIGCRNMWFKGQEVTRQLIEQAGGRFAGNIVREDQGTRAETFITVTVWLLTGKREVWKGVLSPAGVSEADIADSSRYGRQLLAGLLDGRLARGEPVLDGRESAFVLQKYLLVEEVAIRGFRFGARLIRLAGKQGSPLRVPLLGVFALMLGIGICTVIPVTLLVLVGVRMSAAYKRWLPKQTRYLEGS
ncbi:dialkylrecorsinol condensing enzyme [Hydrocarboniphaga sp.]|uniref:dialkylrecorsinol condensing enzyme n=1 Tax=Hydrocarboniphaga sp. TaxID=2033016 RepID=UPI003D1386AC